MQVVYEQAVEQGSLPVVQMMWDKDPINVLYGTKEALRTVSVWDSITPVLAERTCSFVVQPAEAAVTGISYRVRASDNGKLIEEGKVKQWEAREDTEEIEGTIAFSHLMEEEREYQLELQLKTKEYGSLYYHTRLYSGSTENTLRLVAFAKKFSEATFDKKQAEQVLVPYILTGEPRDNQDLSHVDLYYKFSALTWGTLAPERTGTVQTRIQELSSSQISLSLLYQIRSEAQDGTSSLFDVHEFFCLRMRDGHIYILDYKRDMTEHFLADPADLHENGIYLGVGEDYSEISASRNGSYLAFVKGGQVWLLDTKEKLLQKVFGWQGRMEDAQKVQILQVTEEGQLDFLVSGYVAAGTYEGNCQIQCYRYHAKADEEAGQEIETEETAESLSEEQEETAEETSGQEETAEGTDASGEEAETLEETGDTDGKGQETVKNYLELLFYLPVQTFGKPLEMGFGDVAYINGSDQCYLLLGSVLYRFSLKDGKTEVIQDGLQKGHYCVSPAGDRMAWETDNGQDQAEVICELNMETGELRELFPKEGTVTLAGFIESDLIYGVNASGEVGRMEDGSPVSPCDSICIINANGELVREYTSENKKILDIATYDNYIEMKTGVERTPGIYRESGQEKLLSGQKVTTGIYAGTTKRITGQKLTETVVEGTAIAPLGMSRYQVVDTLPVVTLSNLKLPNLKWNAAETAGYYYAFGEGRLQAVCTSLTEAVNRVFDVAGVVRKEDMKTCWNKEPRALYAAVPIPQDNMEPSEESLAACIKVLLQQDGGRYAKVVSMLREGQSPEEILRSQLKHEFCDLQGSQLSHLLYYLNAGVPILAVTGSDTAVLLIGYDTSHVNLYDPAEEEPYAMTLEEAEAYFAERGNCFMTYLAER